MGNPILGVDIAAIINDVISPGVFDVTITRYTQGARDPDHLTSGRPKTPQGFDAKGFWDDFTGLKPEGYEVNDRRLTLIGDSVPAGGFPVLNDLITVHEPIGDVSLFCVRLLSRDPAAAVYLYLCGDRRGPDKA